MPDASKRKKRKTTKSGASKTPRIDVIHGPNLNLLGAREIEVYGSKTLKQINNELKRLGKSLGADLHCFQSNHEGELVDLIQQSGREADFIIINPGAYTHTSIAIRDALAAIGTPALEVHLSNTQAREAFRSHSTIGPVVVGRIEGLGYRGYLLALRYAASELGLES